MRAMRCFNRAEGRVQFSRAGERLTFSSKQTEMFRQIAQATRESGVSSGRRKVASDSSGVVAVFSGSSGTGKTMAAEVIARELRTSLVRVNLNRVVSTYIGETEKNLSRVFDTARKKGAVLLFDEADALFGKRSEVKDSHDRYANIEVSAVVRKFEAYRGLVILSSNHAAEIDPAIMCRVKYLLEFSSPIPAPRRPLRR